MAKRKYTKKSSYWNKFQKSEGEMAANTKLEEEALPELVGSPYYVESSASYTRNVLTSAGDGASVSRSVRRHRQVKSSKFSNISSGLLPFDQDSSGVNVRDTIELCQKAYANVSIFRNAIDIMSELSNSKLKLFEGTKKSRDFVSKWFEKINLNNLKDQYFREYYRSGNIFLYRVDGKFSTEDFLKLSKIYSGKGLRPNQIPIKYIVLNPYDITLENATSFKNGVYKKILNQYDLEKLSNPKTEYDEQVYKGLPSEVKQQIKKGDFSKDGVNVIIDPDKLSYSFYKKQDYEPFAIPFGYPVLDDINWKLELKKIDQSVCRTIENAILLITMGNTPDKGGVSGKNIKAMQDLFKNESVGRVLVSDYTTEAKFIIPDIEKIIGPEKYKIVNQDIKDGLQNIVVGEEKYSNTQVKAQIFLERLKEARESFLNDFLMPQIKMVCQNLGFRKYPVAKFQEIDIKDEVQLQRVATRLVELGVLTPEQGINVIKTGIYPEAEELEEAQKESLELRKQGLFNPLVGGNPVDEDLQGEQNKNNQVKPEAGRPAGTSEIKQENTRQYSQSKIQEAITDISKFQKESVAVFKKAKNIKRISKEQRRLVDQLCESVILSKNKNSWIESLEACLVNFDLIGELEISSDVIEISNEHSLLHYPSAILWHASY
jgi:hypothetical protein